MTELAMTSSISPRQTITLEAFPRRAFKSRSSRRHVRSATTGVPSLTQHTRSYNTSETDPLIASLKDHQYDAEMHPGCS